MQDDRQGQRPAGKDIWFPARRYGWGWGLPVTWQGWVALALFLGLTFLLAALKPPALYPTEFAVGIVALVVAFVAVCAVKGERPRWRWGE